jgi:hypothetical protein
MLAYTLLKYDIKAKEAGRRPVDLHLNNLTVPDMKAEILFRRRQ